MKSLIHAIGTVFQPLLVLLANILAFFYSIIPSYPVDVALLTIVIMAVLTPLTVKSTKNMAAMQALGPEMKKLQQKYKGAENRTQLNEEMMRLYKEHNVNPASGCLPMLLQMPAFLILYDVIRNITNTYTVAAKTSIVGGLKVTVPSHVVAAPRYVGHNTKMYHDIVAAHGQLNSFGLDFAQKLLSHHSSLFVAAPYLLLVVGSVGLQYLQMSRLNARNPQAAQANPQAAMMQKYMPLIFGLIYLNVAAIINVYFIFSSAIRIGTQEVMFRKGIVAGPPPASKSRSNELGSSGLDRRGEERDLPKPKSTPKLASPKGSNNSDNGSAAPGANKRPRETGSGGTAKSGSKDPATNTTNGRSGNGSGTTPAKRSTSRAAAGSNRKHGSGSADVDADGEGSRQKAHPRSKTKRERRAR